LIGNNESLTKYINTIPPLIKISKSLFFNKNNDNFILNNLNELELHSKYTDLSDWKLKDDTDIITYNATLHIIGSIGLGVIDKIANKNIINAVDFSGNLLIESYGTRQILTIDFFSSQSFTEKYTNTLSYEADNFID